MRLEYGPPARMDGELEALAPQLRLSLTVADRSRLLAYLALIQHWSKVYNLTAVRNTGEMFTHHLLDCLAVVDPFRRHLSTRPDGGGAPRILDVGSGAGLPGAVLAILNPDWEITCVDAVVKKTTFIRQVAAELRLPNLHAVHGRVEAPSTLGSMRFDLITSRAFASIADFTSLTRQLLEPTGQWVAMKARLSEEERLELPSDVDLFHVEQLQVPELDADRCLVWMKPVNADSAAAE